MKATCGFVGLVAALAIGYYLYPTQVGRVENANPPVGQIDLVRIKGDLLALAQAERYYLATNGSYATLKQLRQSGNMSSVPETGPRGYVYEVEIDGARHFRIIARPPDAARGDLATLSIDETMQITPH